jgi:hypothetical protein
MLAHVAVCCSYDRLVVADERIKTGHFIADALYSHRKETLLRRYDDIFRA